MVQEEELPVAGFEFRRPRKTKTHRRDAEDAERNFIWLWWGVLLHVGAG